MKYASQVSTKQKSKFGSRLTFKRLCPNFPGFLGASTFDQVLMDYMHRKNYYTFNDRRCLFVLLDF